MWFLPQMPVDSEQGGFSGPARDRVDRQQQDPVHDRIQKADRGGVVVLPAQDALAISIG